jgi:hypothetical protein
MISRSTTFACAALLATMSALSPAIAQSGGGGASGAAGAGSGGAGAGAAGPGGGRGGIGTSSAAGGSAVGGGPPAGPVGGGAPAGPVGGGAPTSTQGAAPAPSDSRAGVGSQNTSGGVIGGYVGTSRENGTEHGGNAVPSNGPMSPVQGAPSRPVPNAAVDSGVKPKTTGRSVSAEDGVTTRNVAPAPCSTSARETDGTTSCVGIPRR